MQGRDEIAAFRESEAFEDSGTLVRDWRESADRVEHDVAHELGAGGEALVREVAHGFGRWREQEIRKMVGGESIDLFGHPPVETP